MAGESCVFKPSVRNKNGEVVSSKLFDSLLHYSSNDREFSKKYYYIGKNQEFLDRNSDKIKYDENGEITFKSLKDLVSFDLPEERLLSRLNEDLGAGEVEYRTAVSLMDSFNKTNPYNDKYMATISKVIDGKVILRVVKKSKKEELRLKENLRNKSLYDNIEQSIKNLGGTVEVVDKEYSECNTENVNLLFNGLYNIVYVSRDGKLTDSAAEGAGYFAVSTLSKHPLVKRLTEYCTPDRQKSLLGDRYNEVKDKPNSNLLTASILIGQHINLKTFSKSPIRKLLDRVLLFFKTTFSKLTNDDVNRIRLEADALAELIAKGFIEQKLDNPISEEDDSILVGSFKNVLKELHALTLKMKVIDKSTYKKWKDIEANASIGRLFKTSKDNWFADICAVDGINEAIKQLADATPEMIEMLDSVNFNPQEASINARKLRLVKEFITHSLNIMNIIDNMIAKESFSIDENIKVELQNAYNILNNLIKGGNDKLGTLLLLKERKLFTTFLEDIYGDTFIEKASKVLFNPKKFKLELVEGKKENIADLVDKLAEDDNFINRYIASMANSSDIINQIAYKAKSAANKEADDATLKAFEVIKELEEKAKELKLNTDRLLEKDRYGNLTGNYMSLINWGLWENDWIEFKQSAFKRFKEENNLKNKTRIELENLWDTYFRPLSKEWHKMHSDYDKASGKYMPKVSDDYTVYKNTEYNNLSREERTFLNEILELKQSFDDLLVYQTQNGSIVEVAHTTRVRMPLFRGSTLNRIENLRRTTPLRKAVGKILRLNVMNAFVVNSEDRDYGSAATRNTLDEQIFGDFLDFELDKVNRLPLYGINKFKDSSELSTDIFGGLALYAAMVNSYAATATIVDVLEVGKDVLEGRVVTDKSSKAKVGSLTRSYKRFCDFLDALVYNLYARLDYKLGKLAISKIIKTLSGFASKIFLGGNVAGGIVNVSTGFIEITKEAIAGETYNIADLKKANLIYFSYLPANFLSAGLNLKYDKVSLFMRRFNVLNNIEELSRNYSTRKSRLSRLNPFGDNLLLPYKSGDHYMQTMSYLATANHYKFKLENKTISMWEALEEKWVDENNHKLGKKLEFKEGVKFIDLKTKEERNWTKDDEINF